MDTQEFFKEIDQLLAFEQALYEALGDDPEYYKLLPLNVEHRCKGKQVWVYVERGGVLWLCGTCRASGTV